jgi:hypothetical protein
MGTVTAMTAAKTQSILDQTIKSIRVVVASTPPTVEAPLGTVQVQYWGNPTVWVNIGNALGPPGEVGPAGPINQAALDAAIATEVTNRNTAITTAQNDSGLGVVRHSENNTDLRFTSFPNVNENILLTGVTVTWTVQANRYYRVEGHAVANTEANAGANFDLHIMDAGDVIARDSAYLDGPGRSAGLNVGRTFKALATASKTYGLYLRSSVGDYTNVEGSYAASYISLTDLGTYT